MCWPCIIGEWDGDGGGAGAVHFVEVFVGDVGIYAGVAHFIGVFVGGFVGMWVCVGVRLVTGRGLSVSSLGFGCMGAPLAFAVVFRVRCFSASGGVIVLGRVEVVGVEVVGVEVVGERVVEVEVVARGVVGVIGVGALGAVSVRVVVGVVGVGVLDVVGGVVCCCCFCCGLCPSCRCRC